jgi:hypothetical protein
VYKNCASLSVIYLVDSCIVGTYSCLGGY